mmetsp:Transcript_7095/g.11573  ORF Transcript_7095/g.11573 Transcript_7095/m.11573 type:complete len:89 (-) Transcript_7095:88-354(-)
MCCWIITSAEGDEFTFSSKEQDSLLLPLPKTVARTTQTRSRHLCSGAMVVMLYGTIKEYHVSIKSTVTQYFLRQRFITKIHWILFRVC